MGDQNTKFYHAATVVKRAQKRVNGLKNENNEMITDKKAMLSMMIDYFEELFRKNN